MIIENIDHDINESMKAHDETKLIVLRMLKAAIKNKEIALKPKKLSNNDILAVISREIKTRKDSIELFTTGNREDLASKEKGEINILTAYLPAQLSEDEIKNIIKEKISSLNASSIKDMGNVMASVMQTVAGQADGSLVSKLVKESLQ